MCVMMWSIYGRFASIDLAACGVSKPILSLYDDIVGHGDSERRRQQRRWRRTRRDLINARLSGRRARQRIVAWWMAARWRHCPAKMAAARALVVTRCAGPWVGCRQGGWSVGRATTVWRGWRRRRRRRILVVLHQLLLLLLMLEPVEASGRRRWWRQAAQPLLSGVSGTDAPPWRSAAGVRRVRRVHTTL